MLEWVREILAPYVATAPPGVLPFLLLDSHRVHMMGSVIGAIEALGVEVEIIPAGCTGLVQPVDVGFNKSFKAKMRDEYNKWLFAQDPNERTPQTSRREVAEWVIEAEKNVTAVTMRNAWKKTGFSYFPNSTKE